MNETELKKIEQYLASLPEKERENKIQEIIISQCPFCAIAHKRIEANIIYEDDKFMAVLDINPASKGHVIIFPKAHVPFMFNLDDKDVGTMFVLANKLSQLVFEEVEAEGTNIFVANGEVAGQKVGHFVLHVIPRFKDDGLKFEWSPVRVDDSEMKGLCDKLRQKSSSIDLNFCVSDVPSQQKVVSEEEPNEEETSEEVYTEEERI